VRDYPPYGNAVVTYTDLLGFSSLIKRSVNSDDAVQFIAAVLERLRGTMTCPEFGSSQVNNVTELRAYAFSDLVVRTVMVPEASAVGKVALNEVIHVATVQFELLGASPISLRGGMSYGQLVATENYVYGPALVRAYELEHNFSSFPRVLVDPRLVQDVLHAGEIAHDFLRMDQDGLWYVDYLFGAFLAGYRTPTDNDYWLLEHHGRIITSALIEEGQFCEYGNSVGTDERTRQKYIWLGRYHNDAVHRLCAKVEKLKWLSGYVVPERLLRF
jgi:hypothetical protein